MPTPNLIREQILLEVDDVSRVEFQLISAFHWVFYVGDGHGDLNDVQKCQAETVLQNYKAAGIIAEVKSLSHYDGELTQTINNIVKHASTYGYVTIDDIVKIILRFVKTATYISVI